MPETTPTDEALKVLASVLLRCTVLGFLLLLLWFAVFMLAGDVVYRLHGRMFGLTPHELSVIHYSGMALVKLGVILFYLIPWAALRLVLRSRRG